MHLPEQLIIHGIT